MRKITRKRGSMNQVPDLYINRGHTKRTFRLAYHSSNLAWIAKKVTLAWTRAHACTEGNEMADKAAKQAAQTNNNKIVIPMPPTHRNNLLTAYFMAKWSDRWNRTTTCKHKNSSYLNYRLKLKYIRQ